MGIRTSAILGLIAAALVLTGCESQSAVAPSSPPGARDYDTGLDFGRAAVLASPATNAQTPALKADADSAQAHGQEPHVMIYSGMVRIVVADISQSLDSIRGLAKSLGGYLDAMDARSITIRVPANKFEDALAAIKRIGEVTDMQVKAEDVTDQMRDLDIRLANAQQARERLLKLIDASTKVEDTVKIEAELERVTETIELLKGKIRALQSQVAYSVLKVELNSRSPQAAFVAATPFPWVRELGLGVVSGANPQGSEKGGIFGGGVQFDLPPGFIRYYQLDDLTEAMSADGMFIKAQRHDNYKGGDIAFWAKLSHRMLAENQSIAIDREIDVRASGNPAHLLEGIKDIPGGAQGYLLLIGEDQSHVLTFEAWGPKAQIEQVRDSLEKAAQTVR
jgi:hypothetical protein